MDNVICDVHRIVVENRPLIDLRSPVEYKKGSVPTAVNLPLVDDQQRHEIGICYKKNGQAAALKLGFEMVSGEVKKRCVASWFDFLEIRPSSVLFCFRGGKRSQIVQQWLKEECGRAVPRLAGGYKSMRRYLIEQLEPHRLQGNPLLLSGKTGVGKTELLRKFANFIDLEGIANHRGSSFGRFLTPQPGLADFENRLAWELIRHCNCGYEWILLEDEGRHVGHCYLPNDLADHFSRGSLVFLEIPLEQRIEKIWEEYVLRDQREHCFRYGEEAGLVSWLEAMNGNLDRIKKRLGGERFKRLKQLLGSAHRCQLQSGNAQEHKRWVEVLICEYYDPMYEYQFKKRRAKVIFKGNTKEVTDFLRNMEPQVVAP